MDNVGLSPKGPKTSLPCTLPHPLEMAGLPSQTPCEVCTPSIVKWMAHVCTGTCVQLPALGFSPACHLKLFLHPLGA
jgi:hypothetical protein